MLISLVTKFQLSVSQHEVRVSESISIDQLKQQILALCHLNPHKNSVSNMQINGYYLPLDRNAILRDLIAPAKKITLECEILITADQSECQESEEDIASRQLKPQQQELIEPLSGTITRKKLRNLKKKQARKLKKQKLRFLQLQHNAQECNSTQPVTKDVEQSKPLPKPEQQVVLGLDEAVILNFLNKKLIQKLDKNYIPESI